MAAHRVVVSDHVDGQPRVAATQNQLISEEISWMLSKCSVTSHCILERLMDIEERNIAVFKHLRQSGLMIGAGTVVDHVGRDYRVPIRCDTFQEVPKSIRLDKDHIIVEFDENVIGVDGAGVMLVHHVPSITHRCGVEAIINDESACVDLAYEAAHVVVVSFVLG